MPKSTHHGRDQDSTRFLPDVPCPAPPRVYVVSEVRLYREGLITSLTGQGGLLLVGNGCRSEALGQLASLRPDVMLLDVFARDSFALPRQALSVLPELRVIAFAVADVEADVVACAEAGFCGYITQDGSVQDVVEAVRYCVADELVCSPRIASMLFSRLGSLSVGAIKPSDDAPLTRREREIAALVARGLQNKEVARQLGISSATIKIHVHNILQKLNIQRRGEIAMLRMRLALHYLALASYWAVGALFDAF
jgi:DNA-binding NarL/FixJ family response regulator